MAVYHSFIMILLILLKNISFSWHFLVIIKFYKLCFIDMILSRFMSFGYCFIIKCLIFLNGIVFFHIFFNKPKIFLLNLILDFEFTCNEKRILMLFSKEFIGFWLIDLSFLLVLEQLNKFKSSLKFRYKI